MNWEVVRAAEDPAVAEGHNNGEEEHDGDEDVHVSLQVPRCFVVLQGNEGRGQ